MKFATRAMLAAALLCASVSHAAVLSKVDDTTVALKRGTSNVTLDVLTATCAKIPGCALPLTAENCPAIKAALLATDAAARESGGSVYQCVVADRSMVTFGPNPPPVCPDKPGDAQRQQTCPAGTVGTWLQDQTWTLHLYPECWVLGEWTPTEPPAGMCAPIDSDSDGVPDSTDQCPTVYATTPNGCPATPPANRAPTIAGSLGNGAVGVDFFFRPTASDPEGGALTFSIAGAPSWMIFRSLDGRITGRPSVAATHAGIVVSVRDPAGNVASLPPATVTVTGGSAPAPVDCVVSAWSAWTAGSWSTCSNGQQSRLETRTRTVVTPAANGGAACPALSETRTVAQSCDSGGGELPPAPGTAFLSWTPPTQNIDGSALTNLAGYYVVYGRTPDTIDREIIVNDPQARQFTVEGLASGTWYFALKSFTTNYAQISNPSNTSSRAVR